MNCPNCGAEMKKEHLYCECCGEDIHIVPDFEPEIEYNLEQTLRDIGQDVDVHRETREETLESGLTDWDRQEELPRKNLKFWWIGLSCVAVIVVIVGAALLIAGSWQDSVEHQAERAQHYISVTDYDKAVEYYQRALELEPDNLDLKFALAEVFFLKNNKVEYEYLLRSIVKDEKAMVEQLESAYGKLIAIYSAREDYRTINELVLSCENESIKSIYQSYLSMAPEFSVKEGYYNSIQPLKLTTFGTGKIYYTLDGSQPSEKSTLYTTPILLENGDYCVKAIYVNEMGIASEVAQQNYYVEIEVHPSPEISVVSGEYEFPIRIEVLEEEEGTVYYTRDGSVPTENSEIYISPIPMPLGDSVFKFIKIKDGKSSQVEERTYRLEMRTEYTPEQAVEELKTYLVETGRLRDMGGRFDETNSIYVYEYLYVTNIREADDFYVIAEVLRDAESNQARTGNYYALNAYNGKIFKLQTDHVQLYELEEA